MLVVCGGFLGWGVFLSGFGSSSPCEFIYLFKHSVCMTLILCLHVRCWSVFACLFQLSVCLDGGVLCLGVAVSLFCLLLPSKSFNMFQFPSTVCVYVCVKRIISACMSVIESAAVEAATSLPPPLPCPPLSMSYALSYALSFIFSFISLPHSFCSPPHPWTPPLFPPHVIS